MKKMTISIVIIIAIIIGVIGSIFGNRRNNEISEFDKISKTYNLIIEANNNLNNLSNIYMKAWNKILVRGSINKKELSKLVDVDYDKFIENTREIEIENFTDSNKGIECLNKYYENSGISDNIQNKLKDTKKYLNDINLRNDKEKKLFDELKLTYNQLINYYNVINDTNIDYKKYESNIIQSRENLKISIENITKTDFSKKN